jgi:hypothetical protein
MLKTKPIRAINVNFNQFWYKQILSLMITTSTIIEQPVDILMNAYEGVNMSAELAIMYNNFVLTKNYKSLSEAERLKSDSLFTHVVLSFNIYCAGVRGYKEDLATCQIFTRRTANLLTMFNKEYISGELSKWLHEFEFSDMFDKMTGKFAQENFAFRMETLIGYIRKFAVHGVCGWFAVTALTFV